MNTTVYVGPLWELPRLCRLTLGASHDAWWMEVRSQRVVNVELPSQWLRREYMGGGRCRVEPPYKGVSKARPPKSEERGERSEKRGTLSNH